MSIASRTSHRRLMLSRKSSRARGELRKLAGYAREITLVSNARRRKSKDKTYTPEVQQAPSVILGAFLLPQIILPGQSTHETIPPQQITDIVYHASLPSWLASLSPRFTKLSEQALIKLPDIMPLAPSVLSLHFRHYRILVGQSRRVRFFYF